MDRIAQLEAQVSDRRGSRGFHGAMALTPRRVHQRNNWGLCQVGWVETSSLVDFFRFFLCSWVFEAISCYFCMLGIVKQQFLVIEWWWRLPEADRMQNTTPRSLEHLAGANGNGSLPWWLRCHPPGVSASAVTGLGFSNPSRTVQHLALKDGFSLCFSMFFRVRPWMKKLSPPRFARRLNRQQAQLDRLEATRSIRSFVAKVQKNLKVGCCWIRTPSDSWLLQYMFLEKYVATSLRRHCDAGDWVCPQNGRTFQVSELLLICW